MLNAVYQLPDIGVVREAERKRQGVVAARFLGNEILPIEEENADTVLWEIRADVKGMSFARSVNTEFALVDDVPVNRYYISPGRFGEKMEIKEDKIERLRQPGTFGTPLDVSAELSRLQEDLTVREQTLIEYIRMQLLVYGTISVAKKDGTTMNVGSYPVKTYTPSVGWTTYATATPLNDFRTIKANYAGYGHSFGGNAVALMNPVTSNAFVQNTNSNDLAGKRTSGLATMNSLADVRTLFMGEDLPQIKIHEGTYLDNSGVPQWFIPTGKVVVVGARIGTGVRAGAYVMTRNGNNENGAPGIYVNQGVRDEAPRVPWTERGHNGGPKINYTDQVIVIAAY